MRCERAGWVDGMRECWEIGEHIPGLKPDLWGGLNVRTKVRTYLRSNGKAGEVKGVRSPTAAQSGGLRMGHPNGCGWFRRTGNGNNNSKNKYGGSSLRSE
jgi:hypothetical protein